MSRAARISGSWHLTRTCSLAASILAWASSFASAQDATVELPPECRGYDLALAGAGDRARGDDVSYVDAWSPSLAAAAACLSASGAERACIEVQGQYDDQVFEPSVARAMGGQRPAQIHRARGRSEAVLIELIEIGVPYERLRNRPPPSEPTYRGVRLTIVPSCLPEQPTTSPRPDWLTSPEVLAERLVATGIVATPTPPPSTPPPPPPAPRLGPFSLDGALSFDLLAARPDDAFSFRVRAGLGWGEARFYARAFVEVGTGDHLGQRAQLAWGVSGGFRPLRWLRVGGAFSQRFGTYRTFDPWFDRSWHLGVEAEQRIVQLEHASVWVGEVLSPIGARYQRARVVNGQILDSPDRRDYALDAQVMLTVRGHFAVGSSLRGSSVR